MGEPLGAARLRLKEKVRVLICGGRDYTSYGHFCMGMMLAKKLIAPDEIEVVIHGACPTGADRMADAWGLEQGLTVVRYPAAWNIHGRGAGPIRNQHMLDNGKPKYVFAFKGGMGTLDMVTRAMAAEITVISPDNLFPSSHEVAALPKPIEKMG